MSKSNAFEQDLLANIFNNTPMAGIGDATGIPGAATVGSLYISLHTGDPGEAGNQATSEAAYTGYARMGLARTSANFNVANGAVNLVNNLEFGACTANPGAALGWFSIGTAATGTGKILYSGTLSPQVAVAIGVIPRLTTAANLVTED